VSELYTQTSLVCQVFWGLLACEILNQKSREVTELTTVRKIKDIIKTLYSESPMQLLHHSSWLLHWCLVFSFTAEKSNGLFAALLADKQNFGDTYLNVVQLRSPQLMRSIPIGSLKLPTPANSQFIPHSNFFAPKRCSSNHSFADCAR
jgi:hypothetical protein